MAGPSRIKSQLGSLVKEMASEMNPYKIWLKENNDGTEADFLNSMRGPQGPRGEKGEKGDKGDKGEKGDKGLDASASATI